MLRTVLSGRLVFFIRLDGFPLKVASIFHFGNNFYGKRRIWDYQVIELSCYQVVMLYYYHVIKWMGHIVTFPKSQKPKGKRKKQGKEANFQINKLLHCDVVTLIPFPNQQIPKSIGILLH